MLTKTRIVLKSLDRVKDCRFCHNLMHHNIFVTHFPQFPNLPISSTCSYQLFLTSPSFFHSPSTFPVALHMLQLPKSNPDIPCRIGYLQSALSYVGGGEELRQRLSAVEQEVRQRVEWMMVTVSNSYSRQAKAVTKMVRRTIRRKVEERLESLLESRIRPWLEEKVYGDEFMPRIVRSMLKKGVENFWLDIKEEFWTIYHTKYSMAPEQHNADVEKPVSWRHPLLKARAFFLYHLHPCDKTYWGRLRDPVFLLLKGLQVFPLYSISFVSFLMVLFAIDRTDEFQLLQFILQVCVCLIVHRHHWLKLYLCFISV